MKIYQYTNRIEDIKDAVEFARKSLEEYKLDERDLGSRMVRLERLLSWLAENHAAGENVYLQIYSRFGDVYLQISSDGPQIQAQDAINAEIRHRMGEGVSAMEANKLREILNHYYMSKEVSIKYEGGINKLIIRVKESRHKTLEILMASLVMGIVFGVLWKVLLPDEYEWLPSQNIFTLVTEGFMRLVKMIISPLIFFTIASAVSNYTDLTTLGRLGSKLTIRYFINALLGLLISVGIVLAFKPGKADYIPNIETIINSQSNVVDAAKNTDVSLYDTMLDIMPGNFFGAFTDTSILQIIFIAFLLGISTAMLTENYRDKIIFFLKAGEHLFSKMINVVMVFLPISVFCSMANTIIGMGVKTLLGILQWIVLTAIVFVLIAVVYILIIWVECRIKPTEFLSKYGEAITATFAMGSCNSSLSQCISAMETKLQVPESTASFSIPIGVSIHSASNCIFYTITLFFLANIYSGPYISPMDHPMIFLSILLLGIGAPSVSGAGPICVAILLQQMDLPMGLISLIIGLDPFISMFKSAASCIEDASVTLSIHRSEAKLMGTNSANLP